MNSTEEMTSMNSRIEFDDEQDKTTHSILLHFQRDGGDDFWICVCVTLLRNFAIRAIIIN